MYPEVAEAKELIAELCRLFYDQGWVSGTGGGISVRAVDDQIVMAPSGVQKERMRAEDMFVLNFKGEPTHTPQPRPPPYAPPKLSECSPLFMLAYEHRNAGAVLHSHCKSAVLATLLDPQASEFTCTHLEMMKGIAGTGFYDKMVVPIIENTARECELTDRMRAAMLAYPRSNAVLVRRHGVYVWGRTWIEAKTQAECYDYLFGLAVQMQTLGVDASRVPAALPAAGQAAESNGLHAEPAQKKPRVQRARAPTCVVLDIEGTVAPISFVAETLFPYARTHLQSFLEASFSDADTQSAIQLLREQADADLQSGVQGACKIPDAPGAEKAAIIEACVTNVTLQMAQDRKTTGLKALQGCIWHEGFASGALRCELFRDVPDALQQYRNAGIKTYIYSSGSRQAQRDLFAHTTVGDMRPYLMGFFDTTSGAKVESSSYQEIARALGCDSPGEILFATDVAAEAQAAKAAGWAAVLVARPGNAPLASDHGFPVISSLDGLLDQF